MNRLLFAATLLTAAGCAHHNNDVNHEVATGTTRDPAAAAIAGSSAPAPANQAAAGTCTSDQSCGARQLCLNSQCTDITANLAECGVMRMHFDYNATDVKAEDKTNLDRMARCLKADRQMTVTIEGNADERGSEDYNITLGEKRAFAVSNYLQSQGVSETQLKTVSYGKDNPRCMEHDEACWAKNRRTAVKPKDSGSRAGSPAMSKRGRKGAEAPKDPGQPAMGGLGGGGTTMSPNNQ